MRKGRAPRTAGRLLLVALSCALLASGRVEAQDAAEPPTAERVQLDETAGRFEDALAGWSARYLGSKSAADRADALKRYVALATRHPDAADPWLVDSVQRSGPGIRVLAGRRIVAVVPDDVVAEADAARVAALLDASSLAVERLTGARPPVPVPDKQDKRPRDRLGRFLAGWWPIAKPVADQSFDHWIAGAGDSSRGPGLAWALAGTLASASVRAAPNHRAALLDPAVSNVVRDLAAREIADPAVVAPADAFRASAKERYETDWEPGCLPGEWLGNDAALAHLFFLALDGERAAKREPADALRAWLTEPRRASGWSRTRVASPQDLALEPLAAVASPGFLDVFRRAGFLPTGRGFEAMKTRVAADELCAEADALRWDDATRGPAARAYRAAAQALGWSIVSDDLMVEAFGLEEKDDAKKARAGVEKLGLVEGFEFLAPIPETRLKDGAAAAVRLLPLAVATAPGRLPFKVKDPVDVSLKWAEVKDPYERLVERTPWGDKKGLTWGGAAIAAIRWSKELGREVRLRPCRGDSSDVTVLAGGRPADRWPDGSVLVPGSKGTEIVLVSASRITCSVPWRDAKSVDDDLAAAAAEKQALALRPWASRRVAAALPSIVETLTKLPDADAVREMRLLAPYRGGDAATCEAMLAHAKGRPAVLGAYLEACRGTRDAAVLARLVALALADDAPPETLARVQYVLDGALFRKVPEKGPALAALWERAKKWMPSAAFAEGEEIRDLHDATSCFRVVAEPLAWGRACIAPSGWNAGHGEGYLALDLPEGPGPAWLTVRWQAVGAGRLTLRGSVTDGRKTRPFAVDVPSPGGDKPQWTLDVFEIGQVPRGRIVVAIDDPCASGCRIDAIALGPKPLD